MENIKVEEGNVVYDSRDNCNAIIESTSSMLICGSKNTVIPKDIITIGKWAFFKSKVLDAIEIPDNVITIEEKSFLCCTGLKSVIIGKSVNYIGDLAFGDCANLNSISISEENKVYDSREDCNAIIESSANKLITGCNTTIIPNSVTEIGDWAFSNCNGITFINIPSSVKRIGDCAFFKCHTLTSATISDGVTSIGNGAFEECSFLETITIPDSITSIGRNSFLGCYNLKSITIPAGTRGKFADLLPEYKNLFIENTN